MSIPYKGAEHITNYMRPNCDCKFDQDGFFIRGCSQHNGVYEVVEEDCIATDLLTGISNPGKRGVLRKKLVDKLNT